MAEIVNLKRVRKSKARKDKAAAAEANRVQHGTPKALRNLKTAQDAKSAREIEGHKLTDGQNDEA